MKRDRHNHPDGVGGDGYFSYKILLVFLRKHNRTLVVYDKRHILVFMGSTHSL